MRCYIFIICLVLLQSTSSAVAESPAVQWKLEGNAPWQARDSQGELVYDGKLWIFGGWFNSYAAPPRDVWNSADGSNWQCVETSAPWIHSDLPMTVVFKNRMWLMGGWYNGRLPGHEAGNLVWSSSDGKNWDRAGPAQWSPRLAAGLVTLNNKMFMLGGTENYYFGNADHLKNDVWASADGKAWSEVTAAAPWKPRAYLQAVTLNGRMYVLGGGNYVPEYTAYNDVWSSADGKTWRQETANAPWHARLWFSSVVYRDHIWVLGGWSGEPHTNWNDVWYSKNGRDWTQLKTETTWKPRHEHSAFVFQDKIWLAGGHAQPLSQEVWSLQLPKDFGQ
ncbi:MAG TPA: galactose oxidase [Planctomycetaceae bacterium]|nr:galactose oxidase [Planctomycetaceae bacterium]